MERIDIAKLLRECPKGMELDYALFEDTIFIGVEEDKKYPILIKLKDGSQKRLTKYGCHSNADYAKCVIYPKGKTTWEGFQRPFKDGDILVDNIFPFIYKDCDKTEMVKSYCGIDTKGIFWKASNRWTTLDKITFATEEQKEKLFKAIKDNGYRWNSETKKLEKLIESKEDTNVEVVMSGIYFDREYYANEVELHLGDYEIEVRDGRTYAVFKNQETKISKPIFKVGDKIKHKDTILTIINLQTNSYIVEDEPDNFGILMFSQQDKWELVNEPKFKVGDKIKNKSLDIFNPIEITGVNPKMYSFRNGSFQHVEIIDRDYELVNEEPKFKVGDRIRYVGDDFPIKIIDIKNNQYHIECFCDKHNIYKNGIIPVSKQDNYMLIPKFDIATLKPFDKVLVRDGNDGVWVNAFFGFYDTVATEKYPFVASAVNWAQCIPYLGNEHLLGTTNNCDEYFNLIS